MVVVLTYTHSPCPESLSGRTDFNRLVGQRAICPKCGQDVEVKPMYFEGNSTERPAIPEKGLRPANHGIRK